MPYKDKEKQRAFQRADKQRLRLERRNMLLKGRTCERCGFDDIRALEFHHRDGTTKLDGVMSLLSHSLTHLLEEADKCDIICANCHAIEHRAQGLC